MSILNRIPMFERPTFEFDIPLYCPDAYVVEVGEGWCEPDTFIGYVDAANGKPIYVTKEYDIHAPGNYDNNVYNLYKECADRFHSGYGNNSAIITIPLINWDEIIKQLPFFSSREYSIWFNCTGLPEYDREGDLILQSIVINFYGHIVDTDEIKHLGSSRTENLYAWWHGTDHDGLVTTGNFPNLLFERTGRRYHTIIYDQDQIDKVWLSIELPGPIYIRQGYAEMKYDRALINSFHVKCTGYNPTVYRDQEPYK